MRDYSAKRDGEDSTGKVGTDRRALTRDVQDDREREKKARLQVLDELAAEGQRLNMGA